MHLPSYQLIEFSDNNFLLINDLLEESTREGFQFIKRTIDDWNTRKNTFSADGEKLFGIVADMALIGIGGLNRDPYNGDPGTGRVRHLYISRVHRRKGYATLLMNTIIDKAREHYKKLRLFTDDPVASEFYYALGFQKSDARKETHILGL